MNKLIILTGDSGCGKTHLMRLMLENYKEDITIIQKQSDREMRPGEENAIEIKPGCQTEEVKKLDYTYMGHNGKVYGFNRQPIKEAFENKKSPVVIVDNEEMLIKLCQEYKGKICPIYMQRDTTDLEFIQELREKGKRTEEQIMQRLYSRHKFQELWRRRASLFGYRFIINAQFLENKQLLNWFEKIAEENSIGITEPKTNNEAKGIIYYFRKLWKDRPHVTTSDRGQEPIIEESEDYLR